MEQRLVRSLLTLLVLVTPVLAACDEKADSSQLRACEEGEAEKWDSCYDYTHKGLHCTLEKLRAYYAEGRFELEELPAWTLKAERNGAPIIYDVRAKEMPISLGDAWGRLEAWASQRHLPIDSDAMTSCAQRTTEAEMREAEGGGRSTTTWEFEKPVPTPS